NCLLPLRIPPENLDLLRVLVAVHEGVATHAGRHGGNARPHRAFSREVAVPTIDLIVGRVDGVGRGDRLARFTHLGYGRRVLGRGRILGTERSNGARQEQGEHEHDGPLHVRYHRWSVRKTRRAKTRSPSRKTRPKLDTGPRGVNVTRREG